MTTLARSGTGLAVKQAEEALVGPSPAGIECTTSLVDVSARQRRLTSAERSNIVHKYQSGATINDLARQLGVRRPTVAAVLDRAAVPRREVGLTSEQIDEATTLYRDGWSLARTGARFDVDAHTVRSALLRRGIRMRDTHGRER